MARLGQVVKQLNVGLNTAVGFLTSKGEEVKEDFNAKITDKQEFMLVKEFGDAEMLKKLEEKAKGGDKKAASEPKKDEGKPAAEAKVEPEKHQFKVVGKVDLDGSSHTVKPVETPAVEPEKVEPKEKKQAEPVKQEPKPVEVEKPAKATVKAEQPAAKPVVEQKKPVDDNKPSVSKPKAEAKAETKPVQKPAQKTAPKAEPKEEPKSVAKPVEKPELPTKPAEAEPVKKESEEVFKLATPSVENKINVIGKIDLSAINNSTRPPKKSKEERRKERIAKGRVENERRNAKVQNGTEGASGESASHGDKKKRKRIGGERVDVSKAMQNAGQQGGGQSKQGGQQQQGQGKKNKQRNQPQLRTPQVNEEDVAKQVKETLARLTEGNKGVKKGAKYRKDKREAVAQRMQAEHEAEQAESKVLKLTEFVTANELAVMMNVPVTQIIQTCFNLGLFVSINQRIDAETINIVADEFGFKTEFVSAEVVNAITEEADAEEDLEPRAPIVTVMGHVDHGKTSLLDYIRKSNVIAGEAGGITQHIGAYNVTLDDGRHITFLDTPGHEAFTAMRARGAQVTDIAIIIVAADDNVMPQTIEAINHASAAGVPIVFAINKVDKPTANPDKIKETLASMNYLVEEWGGKYQSQDISAKQGLGVKELLEKVLLEAELLELKANPNRKASGSILESSLDKGRGYVATVLVSNGTLRVGDVMLAGTSYGRVKAMFNERNQRIKEARPAEPVIVLGLNGAPQAGDNFNVFEEDHEAREIANKREQLAREQGLRTSKHLTLDEIGRRIALGNFQELNIIVKGDVDGSIEALSDSLLKLSTDEIQVNVIHKAVGQISESDVMLAAASNAIIVGFQVRPSLSARKLAEKEEIDIRLYSIIYDAIEQVKDAMEGMLAPEIKEEITATLEIRETFKITKVGTIAGCMVKEGKIKRTNKVRLIRDGIVVYTGELASLKRMKDDVKEVNFGYECGLNIDKYNDVRVGDVIEAYEEVEVKKSL